MTDLGKFVGNGIKSIISYLRKIIEGFNETTQQYGGGGINEINNKLEAVKEKLDTLDVSVKLDDTDIHNIYTLLNDRLMKKVWIDEDDYQDLVDAGEVEQDTLYIRIVEQSNS